MCELGSPEPTNHEPATTRTAARRLTADGGETFYQMQRLTTGGSRGVELLARHLWRSGLVLLAMALLLALAADKSLAQEEPSIVITAPAEGGVLPGPDITVNTDFSGFTISLPLEPKQEPNTGHIAYFLDVEPLCDLPIPLGNDNIIHSGRRSETFAGVPDGEHTIYVSLVYDDNTCIDPALTDSVRVLVGEPPPTTIPSPEATPEPTPTPEPPHETPSPPPPTAAPTQETPALETPPASPSPTTPPPTAVPPTPAATTAPGIAPGTAGDESSGDGVLWPYIAAWVVAGVLAVGAGISAWRVARARSSR